MKLTERFEDIIIFKGKKLRLRLYFDTVLRSFELFKDERLNDFERIDIALDMFIENREDIAGISFEEKSIVINAIFDKFIKDEGVEDPGEGTQNKIYDLDKDAEYIYASFLFDYNLDLYEQQGKLHWKKFKTLLSNLSEESKFIKVIGYRTCEIPVANKHNKKEVERLKKLKHLYALEQTMTVEEIDRKFEQLASILRPRKAVKE